MMSGVFIFSSGNAAALSAEVKGNTVSQVLGIDPKVYLEWLYSHESDNYYLGTPYKPYDHRNPNGDCSGAYGSLDTAGVAGMNCTGFVWHVLTKAAKLSGGDSSSLPAVSGWVSFYTGNNISRRYFSSKEEMLSSGYLEKGDIIWMFETSEYALSDYNHVGIYWGDGTTDVLWHSSNQGYSDGIKINGNVISRIVPAASNAQLYVVLKMGTPKAKLQIVRSSADRETTENNGRYSLQGAKYNVYSDIGCSGEPLGTISTDSEGYGYFGQQASGDLNSDSADKDTPAYNKESGDNVVILPDTRFYCREIHPSKGFEHDETVYEFRYSGSVTGNGVEIYRAYSVITGEQPLSVPVYYSEEDIKWDFNMDGELNIDDVTTLQKLIAKILYREDPNFDFSGCDVDENGVTDVSDVTYIQKVLAKLSPEE